MLKKTILCCHCMLQINFVNVKEGRLITNLLAEFDVKPIRGKQIASQSHNFVVIVP